MPVKATTPYMVNKLNGLFDTNKPKITPTKASGIVKMIVNGWK